MRTLYDSLRIPRESSAADIKTAYRKLVMKHHPDKSSAPESKAIFLAAKEAYEILSDPMKRKSYDATLDLFAPPKPQPRPQPQPKPAASPQAAPKRAEVKKEAPKAPAPPQPTIPQRLAQLEQMFSRGQFANAETLAREILNESAREALPYAILADIAKSRGEINEAARLYAYAAQYAPNDPTYQKRYEELLDRSRTKTEHGRIQLESRSGNFGPPAVGIGMVMAAGSYIVFSNEAPIMPGLKLVSTWSVGLLVMLFLSGVAIGSSFAVGNLLERFNLAISTATGKVGPTLALGIIATVNFWAAAALYLILGFSQKAFNQTTSRFVGGIAAAALLMTGAASISHTLQSGQVLIWGGNILYIGGMCGWMVSDAFRS